MAPAPPEPPKVVGWSGIDISVVGSAAHEQVNYQAALASFVMLKNEKQVLPLIGGQKIAVVGPAAVTQYGLLSDYFGDDVCYSAAEAAALKNGKRNDKFKAYNCIPSIASAIKSNNVVAGASHQSQTTIEPGVETTGTTNTSGIAPALAAVASADVTVMVLGIEKGEEHEGIDVSNTSLPGLQENFALQVIAKAAGKPVVLILVGDDVNSIDHLVEGSDAIIKAFYPSTQGAKAMGAALFGHANRWGKLPVTMYPEDYLQKLLL